MNPFKQDAILANGWFGYADPFHPFVLEGDSLNLFGTENSFRKFLLRGVDTVLFENLLLACIVVSSITLALDQPRTDSQVWHTYIYTYICIYSSIHMDSDHT